MPQPTSSRPRVVVIGAGFGGLAAVRGLRDERVAITLIDRRNYHLFQPLLYQVASGLLDPSEIAHPVRALMRHQRNCRVIMAEVTAIDVDARVVHTDGGDHPYDHLVVAAGSETDYFGNEGARANASGLKQLDDALQLRSRLLRAFERATITEDIGERQRLMTVAVVGAGPTGVEYVGAVLELVHKVLPRDFPELPWSAARVILIDAGDSILASFRPRLRRSATRTLKRRGATLMLGRSVASVNVDGLTLDDGSTLAAATLVWTAGVRASRLTGDLGRSGRQGRIAVTHDLSVPNHPEVLVIGDAAAITDRGAFLPMLAPVAIQSGAHAATSIAARIRGNAPTPFRYHDKGAMATVGRNFAVVQTRHLRLTGRIGWLAWLALHLIYIITFRSRLIVLINWGWNYIFMDRPVRLITLPPQPSRNGDVADADGSADPAQAAASP